MPFPSPGVSSQLRDQTRVSPMAGRFKSLLQDHNLKASILQCSAFILLKNKLSWEESHNLMANNDFPREFSPSDSIERVQRLPGFRQPGSEAFLQTFSGGRSCLCSKIQVPWAWEVCVWGSRLIYWLSTICVITRERFLGVSPTYRYVQGTQSFKANVLTNHKFLTNRMSSPSMPS